MTLRLRADRTLVRAGHHSTRFLLAELTAPHTTARRERPPVNLAFVLDRSGSMAGSKLQLAHRAVAEAIGRLKPTDRFSVVVYDDRIDVVAESGLATPDACRVAVERLREIEARGSTNLAEGWLRGCEQVALHQGGDAVHRVLLLTDGLANVGVTDRDALEAHAAELRARGISTTTFGVGADFDETLLQGMADAGGGHFYFIESAGQIADFVTSEVGEALEVVARDAALELTLPAGVQAEAISPFPCHGGAGRTVVSLGDLVSDQAVAVVLRLRFPSVPAAGPLPVEVAVRDREGVLAGSAERATFEYAPDAANDSQPRERDVDRAVARQFAALARQEAVALNRQGRFAEAAARLRAVAARIARYAGDDAELRAIVAELEGQERRFAAPMAELARKEAWT
ncbi:MAG TPA: VWA domain-containing protein, partial [Candidatus Limnocylindrales bacterium]